MLLPNYLLCVNSSFRVVLGWAYRGLTGGFLLLQNFCVAISVSPHVCFILVLILISMFQGCLRLGLSWFNWWVSFAPEFLCCYFCESSCLFYLSFNFDFYVSKIMHL